MRSVTSCATRYCSFYRYGVLNVTAAYSTVDNIKDAHFAFEETGQYYAYMLSFFDDDSTDLISDEWRLFRAAFYSRDVSPQTHIDSRAMDRSSQSFRKSTAEVRQMVSDCETSSRRLVESSPHKQVYKRLRKHFYIGQTKLAGGPPARGQMHLAEAHDVSVLPCVPPKHAAILRGFKHSLAQIPLPQRLTVAFNSIALRNTSNSLSIVVLAEGLDKKTALAVETYGMVALPQNSHQQADQPHLC